MAKISYYTKEGLQKHAYHHATSPLPISYSTLEAQVVDLSDDIAYSCHDIDDGLQSRLFTEDDIASLGIVRKVSDRRNEEYPDAGSYQRVRLLIRYLINEQVTDLVMYSEKLIKEQNIIDLQSVNQCSVRLIDFSKGMLAWKQELRSFLFDNFYRNVQVMKLVGIAEKCLNGLFSAYVNDPSRLPQFYYQKIKREKNPHRIICDYISGMTDRYALDEYTRIIS